MRIRARQAIAPTHVDPGGAGVSPYGRWTIEDSLRSEALHFCPTASSSSALVTDGLRRTLLYLHDRYALSLIALEQADAARRRCRACAPMPSAEGGVA